MIGRRSLLKYAGLSLLSARCRARACAAGGRRHAKRRTIRCASRPAWSNWRPSHIVSTTLYNGQFPGPLLRVQGRAAGRRRYLQRYRHAGTGPLARADDPERRRWRRRGRHAVRAGARHAPDRLRAQAVGVSLLSHPCRRRRRSQPRHLHRPGRAGLHRAEEQSGRL